MTLFRQVSLSVALALPSVLYARPFQDPATIDARAAASLAGTGLSTYPADRRLKLAACPAALDADPPALGAVTVRCAALGWRIRLPIDGPAATISFMPVVIKRGDPVTVEFLADGFSVTASGTAENEARAGDRVRVRVAQRTDPVMGEAVDVGTVRVAN